MVDGGDVVDGVEVLVLDYAWVSIGSGLDLRVDGLLIRNKRRLHTGEEMDEVPGSVELVDEGEAEEGGIGVTVTVAPGAVTVFGSSVLGSSCGWRCQTTYLRRPELDSGGECGVIWWIDGIYGREWGSGAR